MRHSITLFKEKMLIFGEPAPSCKEHAFVMCAVGTSLFGRVIRSLGNPVNPWH